MNIQQLESVLIPCEGMYGPCDSNLPTQKVACRTRYYNEESNKSPIMCEYCAKAYNEYWDEMWSEYYFDKL